MSFPVVARHSCNAALVLKSSGPGLCPHQSLLLTPRQIYAGLRRQCPRPWVASASLRLRLVSSGPQEIVVEVETRSRASSAVDDQPRRDLPLVAGAVVVPKATAAMTVVARRVRCGWMVAPKVMKLPRGIIRVDMVTIMEKVVERVGTHTTSRGGIAQILGEAIAAGCASSIVADRLRRAP